MEPISTLNSILRLTDYLQDPQEPFDLEAYLLERGYKDQSFRSQGCVGCFSSKAKFSRMSDRKKENTNPHKKCSKIKRALRNKLVFIGDVIRLKRHHLEEGNFDVKTEFSSIHVEEDISESMEAGLSHIDHQDNETAANRMIQWRAVDENKQQCSPDSVLDEIEASPIRNATLWELIIGREKASVFTSNDACSRFVSSKKALQQTRQLLFDSVREAVESRERQRKTGHLMEPDKVRKISCDKMQVWNRRSSNEKKIARLLRSDFLGYCREWNDFEGFRGDIVKEMGDQILEQIKDELLDEVLVYGCVEIVCK